MSKVIVGEIEGPSTTSNKITIASGSQLDIAGSPGGAAAINLAVDASNVTTGTLTGSVVVDADIITTGTLPTAQLDQNIRVSAWVRWSQTGTQSITDSHNISSLSDGGVGNTVFTLTTAMPNANFITTQNNVYSIGGWSQSQTTSTWGWVSYVDGAYTDYSSLSAAVIGG